MRKTGWRLVSALAALLLVIQTVPASGAANADAGIMPIAATETAVTSSELGELNQYWELGKSVYVFETVQGTGNITGQNAVKLYLNQSTSYVSPIKNPISGNYGMLNKQTSEYWMVYKYNNSGLFKKYQGTSSNVSLDYHTAFTDSDYVNMSYAQLGTNLYKDEDGRIFFKAYTYLSDGGYSTSLYRAYFMKTGIEVLMNGTMDAYPDNENYIHVASSSGSGGGGSTGNKVDVLTEAFIALYSSTPPSVTYTGSVQTHPIYNTAKATVIFTDGYTATDAGTYSFFMVPKSGYTWQDGTQNLKSLTWSIAQADPTGELPADFTVNPYSETVYGLTGSGPLMPAEGVTYTCDDPDVGTFEGSVFHAGGKMGTATVTASFAGNKNLKARTWTGTVTVALSGGIYLEDAAGGKTSYPSLQEAYDALPAEGGTIHVLGNVTVDAGLATTSGKSVTIVGDDTTAALTRSGDFTTFTVTDGASLTLESLTVTAASGATANGGAAYVEKGGSLTLTETVTLTANNASGKGGAVYVAADAGTVTVDDVTVQNNQASFGNGIYLEDGATAKVSGGVAKLGDGISIGYDETKTGATGRGTVDVTGPLDADAKLTVEFENPAAQLGSGEILYVKSDTLTAAQLKSGLLVQNPGYTFKVQESSGLSLDTANTVAAVLKNAAGGWTDYSDPQAAIDAAQSVDTIYFATYANAQDTGLNTTEVLLSKTLTIPAGKTLTFASIQKSVPLDNNPVYTTEGIDPVTVKRADGNTEALVYISDGATLTLGNITLDGGAVWPGGSVSISDDGNGGAGTVTTNNTGITAHAPVVVNNGTLTIGTGATIQNNDNNYAAPGAGFGSQNYGGVRKEGRGALTMTGGTIQNCYAREGGGIMNVCKSGYGSGTSPSVAVSGGSITGCVSQQKGRGHPDHLRRGVHLRHGRDRHRQQLPQRPGRPLRGGGRRADGFGRHGQRRKRLKRPVPL